MSSSLGFGAGKRTNYRKQHDGRSRLIPDAGIILHELDDHIAQLAFRNIGANAEWHWSASDHVVCGYPVKNTLDHTQALAEIEQV